MIEQSIQNNTKIYHQSYLPIFYENEKHYMINLRFSENIKMWKLEKGTKFKFKGYEAEVEEDHFYSDPHFQYPWLRLFRVDNVSGVYDFFHFRLGHLYIGESVNIKSRVKTHIPNVESSDPEFWYDENNNLLTKIIERFNIKSINKFLERCILVYFPINGDKKDRRNFERKMIVRYKPIFNKGAW